MFRIVFSSYYGYRYILLILTLIRLVLMSKSVKSNSITLNATSRYEGMIYIYIRTGMRHIYASYVTIIIIQSDIAGNMLAF